METFTPAAGTCELERTMGEDIHTACSVLPQLEWTQFSKLRQVRLRGAVCVGSGAS